MSSDIQITAEPMLEPEVCRFVVDRPLLEKGLRQYNSPLEAESSPLPRRLFKIPGVMALHLQGHTVTVTKTGDEPWQAVGKQVGAAIRAHIAGGEPAVNQPAGDDELRQRVARIIQEQVNPGVAAHGGVVTLEDVHDNKVFVSLGGGCQGCAMSQMTLKQGIETTLKQLVPEITEVVDVTDHAVGENPFY